MVESPESAETSCMLVHTLGPELGLGLGRARLGYGLGRAGLGLRNCGFDCCPSFGGMNS